MRHFVDKKKGIIVILGIFFVFMLAGCSLFTPGKATPETEGEKEDTGFIMTGPGSYDSADTAVIVNINLIEKNITFLNLQVSKNYTLNYDGTTVISDQFGQPMSLEQLREGDIVDLTFLKSKKRLATLMISESSWTNEEVSRYNINTTSHDVTIGESIYKITKDTKIFSDGEEIESMDLNSTNILTFHGIGNTVYSIVVEKGHGYLRLTGDESFIGGWIEVGHNIIHQITDDMLLTVPEGSYQVLISIKGGGGSKNVIINRNEEVTLDIGDLEIEETKFGQVIFAMNPSAASLYVDGNLVDTSGPVTLEYGIHQLIARADGYSTVTSYLKVAEASAGIEITLDEEKEDDYDTVSGGDGSTTTGYYQVYIDAPVNVEVYVDGNYAGISPISFKKEEGVHVITLRKTGYETRSYTIQVDGEKKDVTFSFVDLNIN